MKGWVYMIDYREDESIHSRRDQCECVDKSDLIIQLRYLIEDGAVIEEIKLVNDDQRDVEKEISKSLRKQCNRIINKR